MMSGKNPSAQRRFGNAKGKILSAIGRVEDDAPPPRLVESSPHFPIGADDRVAHSLIHVAVHIARAQHPGDFVGRDRGIRGVHSNRTAQPLRNLQSVFEWLAAQAADDFFREPDLQSEAVAAVPVKKFRDSRLVVILRIQLFRDNECR